MSFFPFSYPFNDFLLFLKFRILVVAYKVSHGLAPACLTGLFPALNSPWIPWLLLSFQSRAKYLATWHIQRGITHMAATVGDGVFRTALLY